MNKALKYTGECLAYRSQFVFIKLLFRKLVFSITTNG